jgi:hypothetical protein
MAVSVVNWGSPIMKIQQLFKGASFGPDALKVIGRAFEAAWVQIEANFGSDPNDIAKARYSLATAILSSPRKTVAICMRRRKPRWKRWHLGIAIVLCVLHRASNGQQVAHMPSIQEPADPTMPQPFHPQRQRIADGLDRRVELAYGQNERPVADIVDTSTLLALQRLVLTRQ